MSRAAHKLLILLTCTCQYTYIKVNVRLHFVHMHFLTPVSKHMCNVQLVDTCVNYEYQSLIIAKVGCIPK